MSESENLPELVTLSEFAKLFGVSVGAVTNWRARLANFPAPAVDGPKRPVYSLSALVRWTRENARVPTTQCDPHLSPFFFLALPIDAKATPPTPEEALAIVAVEVLKLLQPGETKAADDILRPALELHSSLAVTVRSELRAALIDRVATSVAALVDELRDDYAAMAPDFSWAERTAVAQVVAELGGRARRAIDPCCGNGGLLSAIGRRRGADTKLIGIEYDPIRAASAYALLRCEGFRPKIRVGSSFELLGEQPPGTLLVASPPADATQRKTDHGLDDWLRICTQQLAANAPARALVVVPTGWILHPQPDRSASDRDLILNEWLTAVVTLSPSLQQRSKSVSVLSFRTHVDGIDPVLTIDGSGRSDFEVLSTVRHALSVDSSKRKAQAYLPDGARIYQLEELQARGTAAPASFSSARKARGTMGLQAAPTVPVLPRLALSELQSDLDRQTRPRRPDHPRVSVATLGDLTRTKHIAIGDPEELRYGSGRIVTIRTTPTQFGHVSITSSDHFDAEKVRRGLVGIRVLPAGKKDGLVPEFLAAWLASEHVQHELENLVSQGKVRRSLSRADLLSLPADFPDVAGQKHAAARWRHFESLDDFSRDLINALTAWKLRLMDSVDTPPTEG